MTAERLPIFCIAFYNRTDLNQRRTICNDMTPLCGYRIFQGFTMNE